MNILLERLNLLRKDRNVSEFARFLGVNQKSLDNYIKGLRTPTIDFVLTVCTKCNVSSDYLLGLSNNQKQNSEFMYYAGDAQPLMVAEKEQTKKILSDNSGTIALQKEIKDKDAMIRSQQETIAKLASALASQGNDDANGVRDGSSARSRKTKTGGKQAG